MFFSDVLSFAHNRNAQGKKFQKRDWLPIDRPWVNDRGMWRMTLVDVRFCSNQCIMERANRNWYSQSFSRSFIFILAPKDPQNTVFTWKCYFFLLREASHRVYFIRHEVILHEEPPSCGGWDVKHTFLHDFTSKCHVPRNGSRTRIFSLAGLSNFITKNVFQ